MELFSPSDGSEMHTWCWGLGIQNEGFVQKPAVRYSLLLQHLLLFLWEIRRTQSAWSETHTLVLGARNPKWKFCEETCIFLFFCEQYAEQNRPSMPWLTLKDGANQDTNNLLLVDVLCLVHEKTTIISSVDHRNFQPLLVVVEYHRDLSGNILYVTPPTTCTGNSTCLVKTNDS